MSTELTDLERRVAHLETVAAITDVLYQYAYSLDYGDEAGFLGCFTDGAVWEAQNAVNGSVMRHEGRVALAEFVAGHTRPPSMYHKHLVVEPRVEVDGDVARSSCYFVLVVGAPGGLPEVVTFGRYLDTLRKEDGTWRIATRRAEAEAWNPLWGELRNARRRELASGTS
jgi:3-phenylpropionate/cinnamic acid dioxygenase small subunit